MKLRNALVVWFWTKAEELNLGQYQIVQFGIQLNTNNNLLNYFNLYKYERNTNT